jgi:flavin reductase (DIM6/NTAB) family NADH-FMN oxidoreductase RutF
MDETAKKSVLRGIPYGLFALTVASDGADHALTVNWLTQASFEPPMIAVAVENDSNGLAMIRDARAFALCAFGPAQRELAARLGRSSARHPAKLEGVEVQPGPQTGSPLIAGAPGWVECRLVASLPSGDHTLVLGEVVEAGAPQSGPFLTLAETGMKYAG